MTPRRKPGPKPRPASKRKVKVVGVRVSDAEYRRFERLAKRQHISVGSWARAQLLKAAEQDETAVELEDQLEEAKRLVQETRILYQSAVPKGTGRKRRS